MFCSWYMVVRSAPADSKPKVKWELCNDQDRFARTKHNY